MPPEQISDAAEADERADIYSVGVVAFQLITGALPFDAAEGAIQLEWKRSFDPLSLAQRTSATYDASLEEFLATCMARNRGRRYPSAAQARAAWERVVDSLNGSVLPNWPHAIAGPNGTL